MLLNRPIKLLLLLLTILVLLSSSTQAESNIEISSPTQNGVTFPEDDDFATIQFSDPWDMSNTEDIGLITQSFTNTYFSNGRWYGTTSGRTGGGLWLHFGGFPGSYFNGREGAINKINIDKYRRFIVSMYSQNGGYARLRLYRDQALKNMYYLKFDTVPGWQTYLVDIPNNWQGLISGLWFSPANTLGDNIIIDWIRLTPINDNKTTDIAWNNNGDINNQVEVFLDDNSLGYDGIFSGSADVNNVFNLDTSLFSPGIRYVYLKAGQNVSVYSGPIKNNQSPVFKITDPDQAGGEDWARKYLRNSWDFNRYSDIASLSHIAGKRIRKGIFSGVNTTNDPILIMRTSGKTIDTNKYRFLSFRYKYDSGFDLVRGTMSRFMWKTVGRGWNISDDVVTYDGDWRTYTIDLKKIRLNGGINGWRGKTAKFRFDPNEDPYRRRFYIDYIKLAAEDRLSSNKYFDIKYTNFDSDDPSINLKLFWDADKIFGNGNEHLITSKIIGNGPGVYRWIPARSSKRRVWIYGQVSDGINTNGFYSTGSLRVHM